jgi:hypothetical protein
MTRRSIVLFVSLILVTPCLLAQDTSQSLADFARKENERKKNEPPPKAVLTGEGAAVTYVGCYQNHSVRDLQGASFIAMDLTNDSCQAFCAEKGFKYAGTEFGSQCYCGNSYGKYGGLDDTKCSSNCSGKAKEKCGGAWANSVYYTAGVSGNSASSGSGKSDASAILAGVPLPSSHSQTGGETFSVVLSTMQNTVKAGSAVWVSFVVTNLSDHKIRAASFGDDLQFEVEDGSGHRVSYAKHKDRNGRTVISVRNATGHGIAEDMEPGKTVKGQLPVSHYYDLSRPGQYTIQATRKDPNSNEVRESNAVTVTVTP